MSRAQARFFFMAEKYPFCKTAKIRDCRRIIAVLKNAANPYFSADTLLTNEP